MRHHFVLLIAALLTTLLLAGCCSEPSATSKAPTLESANPEGQVERTLAVLPDSAFKQQLTVVNPPTTMSPGARAEVTIRVKNTSDTTWPMRGRVGDGVYQVNLGDRWLDAENKDVKVDERVFLPRALKPGEEVEMLLVMVAPANPGDYNIEVDMVQEGVAWFSQKGATQAKLKIKVQ